MRATSLLRQAQAAATSSTSSASHHHEPLIRFIGKRTPPQQLDHSPLPHPAAPTPALPNSFAAYRSEAQQYGPLGHHHHHHHHYQQQPSPQSTGTKGQRPGTRGAGATAAQQHAYGAIGGHTGAELGPVQPSKGEYFDRSQLPARFRRLTWSEKDIEALETGGASLYG